MELIRLGLNQLFMMDLVIKEIIGRIRRNNNLIQGAQSITANFNGLSGSNAPCLLRSGFVQQIASQLSQLYQPGVLQSLRSILAHQTGRVGIA